MKNFIIPRLCSFRSLKELEIYIPNNSVNPEIRKNSGYFLNQTWDMKSIQIRDIRNILFCSNMKNFQFCNNKNNFLFSFKFKKIFSTGKVGDGGKNGI